MPHARPPAISAPGLTGPASILTWPLDRPGHAGRPRRAYRHVRLEVDLEPETVRDAPLPVVRELAQLLKEREIVEIGDLLALTGEVLHAFGTRDFAYVDHWEAEPGGWLPIPEPHHDSLDEPVGHLLKALASARWRPVAAARAFKLRLRARTGLRADVVVRRVHRERRHTLSVDLTGRTTPRDVRALLGAIRARLPVLSSEVTEVAYA